MRKLVYILFCFIGLVKSQTLTSVDNTNHDTINIKASAASSYSFINLHQNRIYYGKDSSAFISFFRKLEQINKGKKEKINIVHIGGSHVQGGNWSHAFFQDFPETFRANARGYFIFPYKIAKSNGQPYATSFSSGRWTKCRNVKKEYCLPLGMSGWSVSTQDSTAYFGFALTKRSVVKSFNIVKVYHNFSPDFELHCLLKSSKKDFEDLGYTLFKLEHQTDSICFSIVRKDTCKSSFTLFGFSAEQYPDSGFYLAALGANGASTNSFLRCDYFTQQLRTIKPDLVIFSLGVNDVQSKEFTKEHFMASYDSLINMVKIASPQCAIMITTTTDNYIKRKTPNIRTEKAAEAIFTLIEKRNIAVWDMYNVMGGYKSIVKWGKAGLAAKDRVHLSPKGYKLMGHLMFDALYRSYLYNLNIKN